jgi:hypothetical protein
MRSAREIASDIAAMAAGEFLFSIVASLRAARMHAAIQRNLMTGREFLEMPIQFEIRGENGVPVMQ